ncbi:MAG: BON domain-containing protein [Acidobacteria bacterium]|nr:BON domain-containing protein [Acidobacteriota bacterium]MBV9483266.1 BON domain-containing protein [Acidobacteriota bacterium]
MKGRIRVACCAALFLLLFAGIACNQTKVKPDAQVAGDIQNKFNQDSGLQGKQLNVQAANGVVTLDGAVDNATERDAAGRLAASVEGVKTVVNNLQVQAPPPPDQTAAAAPPPPEEPKPAPRAKRTHRHVAEQPVAEVTPPAQPTPPPVVNNTPPPPPPPPAPKRVTIPSGTTLAVRLVDAVDSERSQAGQTFHATLDSPLAIEGDTAIPAGYDVEGHVVDVRSAGKFAGQSLLVLQLDRIAVGDKYYNIQTDQYKRQGNSRGKNTAEKVGAGAAIGAIIGGLAGGGKGAAIGAAAGGGLGGGVQAATRGQQIKLASETVLNFTLQNPVTVIPSTQGPNAGRPKLENN